MKDIRIGISKEFPHLWVKIEVTIDEMDDIKSKLAILEDEAQEYHKSRYPHLYDGGEDKKYVYTEQGPYGPLRTVTVPTINRKYEEMEWIIKDCGTLDELSKHKEYCVKNPDLMPAYMNQLKKINEEMLKNLTGGVKV